MRRIQSLVFCFTLCFAVAKSIKSKKPNALDVLKDEMKCWKDEHFVSKKVLFKNSKISINNFYKVTSADLIKKWSTQEHNITDQYLLMSKLISCEYSESVYKILDYIKQNFNDCVRLTEHAAMVRRKVRPRKMTKDHKKIISFGIKNFQSCVKDVFLCISGKFSDLILKMLFTLRRFINGVTQFESNAHDVFKILLSLYLHAKNYENIIFLKNPNPNRKIKSYDYIENMNLLGTQVSMALKEFIFRNCRSPREFSAFVEEEIKVLTIGTKSIALIIDEITLSEKYVSENTGNLTIRTSEKQHTQLLDTLELNINIKVKWGMSSMSMHDIYDTYINNSTNVQTILKYDHIMVEIMTNLLYSQVANEIEPMLNQNYNDQQSANILTEFNTFVSKLKASKHPIVFINKMIELKYGLYCIIENLKPLGNRKRAKECFDRLLATSKVIPRTSTDWILYKPNKTGSDESNTETLTISTFKEFSNKFILEQIENIYLNPMITNILYKTSYLIMSGPFEYLFDYKNFHTTWTNSAIHRKIDDALLENFDLTGEKEINPDEEEEEEEEEEVIIPQEENKTLEENKTIEENQRPEENQRTEENQKPEEKKIPEENQIILDDEITQGDEKPEEKPESSECNAISSLLQFSNDLFESIQKCKDEIETFTNSSDKDTKNQEAVIEKCLKDYLSSVSSLFQSLIEQYTAHSTYDIVEYQTRKLLLTMANNLTYGTVFDGKTIFFVNNKRIDDLINFQTVISDKIITYKLLRCEKSAIPMAYEPTNILLNPILQISDTDLLSVVNNYYYKKPLPREILYESTTKTAEMLHQITMIQKFSQFITNSYLVFHGSRIKFNRKGREINISDVRTELIGNTFELQDLVELQYLTIKWITSWFFSVFVNILNGLVHYEIKYVTFNLDCFRNGLNYLSSLNWGRITNRPIKLIVDSIFKIIQFGGMKYELKYLKLLIINELYIFGVRKTSLPEMFGNNVSDYINQVCTNFTTLQRKESDFSGVINTVGLDLLLTGMPNSNPRDENEIKIN